MANQEANLCFHSIQTVPKYCLQSPLYAASNRKQANHSNDGIIKSYSDKEIVTSSTQLNQFDLAVSMAFKKIILQSGKLHHIQFTLKQFAQCLGKTDGGQTRKRLIEALVKSHQLHLIFNHGDNRCFDGYRLTRFEENTYGHYTIDFNLDYMHASYAKEEIGNIDMDQYSRLPSGLISWLYGLISSDPQIKSIDLDSLYYLSGSNYISRSDFKKSVKYALNYLHQFQIIAWHHGVTRDNIVFWEHASSLKTV